MMGSTAVRSHAPGPTLYAMTTPLLHINHDRMTRIWKTAHYEGTRIVDIMFLGTGQRKIVLMTHVLLALMLFKIVRSVLDEGIPKFVNFCASLITKMSARKVNSTTIVFQKLKLSMNEISRKEITMNEMNMNLADDGQSPKDFELEQNKNYLLMLNDAKRRIIDVFMSQDRALNMKLIDAERPKVVKQEEEIISYVDLIKDNKAPEKPEDIEISVADAIALIKGNTEGANVFNETVDSYGEHENLKIIDNADPYHSPENISEKIDEVEEVPILQSLIPDSFGISLEPFTAENMESIQLISFDEENFKTEKNELEGHPEVKKSDRTLHELAEQLAQEEELIRILGAELGKLADFEAEEEYLAVTVAAAVTRARALEEAKVLSSAANIVVKAHEITEEEQRRVAMAEGITIIPEAHSDEIQVEKTGSIFLNPINTEQIGAIFFGLLCVSPIFIYLFPLK